MPEEVVSSVSPRMVVWMFILSLSMGVGMGSAYVVTRAQESRGPLKVNAHPALKQAPPTAVAAAKVQVVEGRAVVQAAESARGFRVLQPQELAGRSFVQVGVIEQPNVAGFVDDLTRHGFQPQGAAGLSASNTRILLGPVAQEAIPATMERLTAAGFASFPVTY